LNTSQKQGIVFSLVSNMSSFDSMLPGILLDESDPQKIESFLKLGGIFSRVLVHEMTLEQIKGLQNLATQASEMHSRPEWKLTEQDIRNIVDGLQERHKDSIKDAESFLKIYEISFFKQFEMNESNKEMVKLAGESWFRTSLRLDNSNLRLAHEMVSMPEEEIWKPGVAHLNTPVEGSGNGLFFTSTPNR